MCCLNEKKQRYHLLYRAEIFLEKRVRKSYAISVSGVWRGSRIGIIPVHAVQARGIGAVLFASLRSVRLYDGVQYHAGKF